MAKTKISEWSTTPSSNTDIDGINIAEGCAPSGINDAIRDLMAQVRSWQSGASGDPFNGPMNGTVGATTAYAGAFTTLSASSTVTLSGGTANGVPYLNGSKVLTSGSALSFDSSLNILSVSGGINSIIGATNPLAGAFTTINASGAVTFASASTVTLSGGTANGVTYLNGSNVLTSGSALTFNGTALTSLNNSTAQSIILSRTSAVARNWGLGIDGDGGFRLTDATGSAVMLSIIPNGVAYLASPSELLFKYNTSVEGMRLTSTGLGIGTSSPSSKLDVTSSGAVTATVRSTSTVGSRDAKLRLNVPSAGGDDPAGQIEFTYDTGYTVAGSIQMTSTPNNMKFFIGASEGMRLNSTGLGIGTSSPNYSLTSYKGGAVANYLQVASGATGAGSGNGLLLGVDSSGNGVINAQGAVSLLTTVAGVLRTTIDSSGNLGLGVTPSAWQTGANLKAFQVGVGAAFFSDTNSAYLGQNIYQNSVGTSLYINTNYASKYQQSSSVHSWHIAPSGTAGTAITFTQAMTLDASGRLLLGTTSSTIAGVTAAFAFDAAAINTGYGLVINGNASNTQIQRFSYAGTAVGSIVVSSSITTYNTISDQRLKENIVDADSASSLIDSLQVRKFDWKADGLHQRYGFVAQELVTVAPEAVHQPEDTEEMMAVDYSKLVPMLVKEIQSLRKRLADAGL